MVILALHGEVVEVNHSWTSESEKEYFEESRFLEALSKTTTILSGEDVMPLTLRVHWAPLPNIHTSH